MTCLNLLRNCGTLTARALAQAGHTVYASMRETEGRNAPHVEKARAFAAENKVDLRTIELDVGLQQSADAGLKSVGSSSHLATSLIVVPPMT